MRVKMQIGEPGHPVFPFDPNDWCGDRKCKLCEGRIVVDAGVWDLRPGQRVTLEWFDQLLPAHVVRPYDGAYAGPDTADHWEVEPGEGD